MIPVLLAAFYSGSIEQKSIDAFWALDATASAVDQTRFIAYWVILGVLSSIGLGSGLHTFVLFLGPHILRVGV